MIYIQERFEGIPCEKATLFGDHGCVHKYSKWCTSFKVGDQFYAIRENRLVAYRVIGFFYSHGDTLLYVECANGNGYYVRINESRKFFKSVDDYYRFVEGDENAKIALKFVPISDVIPTHALLNYGTELKYAKWYYSWDMYEHKPKANLGYIRRLYHDGKDWYIQASPYNDKAMPKDDEYYYLSKADCIKKNMITEIVDFNAEEPSRAVVKVEIKVTPPAPKVRKLTIIEE